MIFFIEGWLFFFSGFIAGALVAKAKCRRLLRRQSSLLEQCLLDSAVELARTQRTKGGAEE